MEVVSPLKANSLVCMRLPKLEAKTFNWKIHEWTDLWDSFRSVIHENKTLNDIDKFTYLCGAIEEPMKPAIAGFSLTEGNYKTAVELLQRRFGNKTIVQRAHINELINVKPVFNAKDSKRLCRGVKKKSCPGGQM